MGRLATVSMDSSKVKEQVLSSCWCWERVMKAGRGEGLALRRGISRERRLLKMSEGVLLRRVEASGGVADMVW